MTRSWAKFLQAAIACIGVAVLLFLLWEPTAEGRNAHATLFQVYFHDPFLACAYGASAFFFIALYQAFRLAGDAGRGALSPRSLRALGIIKWCAFILLGFVAVGEACLLLIVRGTDDIAGGVFMGGLVGLIAASMAVGAALFERRLRARVVV